MLVGPLALALAVAACGGGGRSNGGASLGDKATTSPGGSSDNQQAAVAFARCMRQHGINMPDPNPDIQWGQLNQAAGWDAAWQACRQLLPPATARKTPGQAPAERQHDDGWPAGRRPKGPGPERPRLQGREATCRDKLPAEEKQQKK